MAEDWIRSSSLPPLVGDEQLRGLNATVNDFWRWAFNDLRDNTTRGVLAELLVARALGDTSERRVGWANYDVLSASGIRVEVKSSGRLQSWSQRRLSTPIFGRITGRSWDPDTQRWGETRELRADVFVFALQACSDPTKYDVLDLSQWEFYVVPASRLEPLGSRSISLATLLRIGATRVVLSALGAAVEAAHAESAQG